MKTEEIRAKRDQIGEELLVLADTPDADLTDEQRSRWTEATTEWDTLGSDLATSEARDAKIEEVRSAAQNSNAVVTGDASSTRFSAPNVNRGSDPFAGSFNRDSDEELRERAKRVVGDHTKFRGVSDETRGGVMETVERYEGETARSIAELVITTGSPEYIDAFRDFTSNPSGTGAARLADMTAQSRAAMSTTAANGGVLIPHFLDPTINLTNAGTNNSIRQLASTVQITVSTWEGVTGAGVNAEWLGEGVQAADASPTFGAPSITPSKAAAWLFGSYEMLADSGFDDVGREIADAFDRLEETGFTTGTGSGQPTGLITALSGTGPSVAGSSGAAGAADFVIADIYAIKNALTPRFRRNAIWMGNPAILDKIRQFGNATAGTNNANFWVDLGADYPATLLGRGVYEDEAMDSTIVSGSNDDVLLFGDMKQYKVVDRVGTTIMYNPLVLSTNANRPTGQAGWFAFKRTGANVITSNGFKLLRL
jgi:HK97 family phage major capsid protein